MSQPAYNVWFASGIGFWREVFGHPEALVIAHIFFVWV
jgi:hypothetical protein